MPIDVFIHLDELRCIEEWDASGHSEPYIWDLAIWSDTSTRITSKGVGSMAINSTHGARNVVKSGMKAGDRSPLPSTHQGFRIPSLDNPDPDGVSRHVGIVVALWEADETPAATVRAAYGAFVVETPAQLGEFIRENGRLPRTPAEILPIVEAVRSAAFEAGQDTLSWWEKVQIGIGSMDLDDEIGVQGAFFSDDGQPNPLEDDSFTLQFVKVTEILSPFGQPREVRNRYELDGRLELRQPPAPDPCETQAERVRAAQRRLDSINGAIKGLQQQLHGGEDSKAAILQEIRQIRDEEIPPAVAELEQAQNELKECRLRPSPVIISNFLD
ncbi:hypothetical protein ABZ419_25615 [Streptomyces cinnamoneus]|uniref:hypothetical protein n=1 Tax=Streptomyces cinnamoneus TaxID=53446 RepID=UPI0034076319